MKLAGMIGGIGPESTIVYYRRILECWRERTNDGSSAPLIINSIDLKKLIDLAARDRSALAEYLAGELAILERAGAQIAFLGSNTPHTVFDQIKTRTRLPLVSIVDATLAEVRKQNLRKPALFGTRFTMDSGIYGNIVLPDENERAYIHDIYINELVNNVFRDETRNRLLSIARRLIDTNHIDSLILGGTELPLILKDNGGTGIPFLDTTIIHADAVVERMLE